MVRPEPPSPLARWRVVLAHTVAAAALGAAGAPAARSAESLLPPGFRPAAPTLHALTGARVIPRPGREWSNAVVILRDDRILAAGPGVPIPPEARVWDLAGLTLYPGFIEPYLSLGTNAPVALAPTAPIEEGRDLRAAGGPRFFGIPGQEKDPGSPGPGYGYREVHPETRVAATYAPDAKLVEALREQGFTAAHFVPGAGLFRGQGAVVALGDRGPNAALLKADASQVVAWQVTNDDVYPDSLMGAIALTRQTLLDAQHYAADQEDAARRPGQRSRPPFNTALAALQTVRTGLPVFWEPGSPLMVPRAAQVAAEFQLTRGAIVATGQEWRRADLMAAVPLPFIVPVAFPALPKLPAEDAWESIGLDLLRHWDWAPETPALLRQAGRDIALTTHGLAERKEFRRQLRAALDRGLTEADALTALTTLPATLIGLGDRLGAIEPGRLAHLTVVEGSYFDPEAKVRAVWIDGLPIDVSPAPVAGTEPAAAKPDKADKPDPADKSKAKESATRELRRQRVARDPLAGRGVLAAPPALWIRNTTLWTCGPQGVLTNANLLVRDGRIVEAGAVDRPSGAEEIDGTGMHVSPGILDCHSHSAILGGVNEGTLPSSAMVRVADVIHSETDNLHQQLAGGTTLANLLHGSANPIGGQSQVIKLRDGAGPDGLVFDKAPGGIKFALGENVKQSNWGDNKTTRFPQTRMGVPVFHENRFTAARQYREARRSRGTAPDGSPLRRDLELEALAEILEGTRLIHCHSYRQDEVVVFLRTMESFGVRVGTLQHILEGYKVADEIARHGAGASAFADWWAYKFEVIDAIPHAGSLMHARGVNVSFNSDSSDHARRLNLEAAKAVKYGGTPEADALRFVTLNPARQLGIDRWVGSLEPGKDADFVLWSGHPLDTRTVCLQTWIEGRKYFDRALEPARAAALRAEREALVAKARKVADDGGDAKTTEAARERFFLRALEQARHLGVQQCADCQLPNRQ